MNASPPPDLHADIAIVGNGFAGMALALAVHHLAHGQVKLCLIGPPALSLPHDLRACALTASSCRLLTRLNAWPDTSKTQAIIRMRLSDSALHDGARPGLLTFDASQEDHPPLAHMVMNSDIATALRAACNAHAIPTRHARVIGSACSPAQRVLQCDDGTTLGARLVVACDGAHSVLREQSKLRTVRRDYPQSALVTTVAHARPHHGEALQHFLPAGSFAALPLPDDAEGRHRSSIVWTERQAEASRILSLSPDEQTDELLLRLGYVWGAVSLLEPLRAYPLQLMLSRERVAERLALVGDAAQTFHPLAGQGLNMALRDVAALAETVTEHARLGLDFGTKHSLLAYQRWRRFDTLVMGGLTHGLNMVFARESALLRGVRSIGLQGLERTAPLKSWMTAQASGLAGKVPSLMRGKG